MNRTPEEILAWAQKVFSGEAQIRHVVPTNDIIEHDTDFLLCVCGPRIDEYGDNRIVIHNSMDGREKEEGKG